MSHAVEAGVLRGRPFGGVCIAWSLDLYHVNTPISNYRHKRIVSVELSTATQKFLLLSVYMPFIDSSNREECLAETADAISMIEVIIESHPNHLIIIGGDLNTPLRGDSPYDALWNNVASQNQLSYRSNLFSSPGYRYRQDKLGQQILLDHFIVSSKILNDGMTSNHQILDDSDNLSDHLPIIMTLLVSIQANKTNYEKAAKKTVL